MSDVLQLPARIAFSAYYITNVDRLIEWALMHGAIDHPHTMVFTSGDFGAFSGLMEKLMFGATAFEALPVVGYRGSAPNFRRILKSGSKAMSWCMIPWWSRSGNSWSSTGWISATAT